MPGKKTEKSIECQVVKVLMSTEAFGGSNQLRIVRWIVDGKDTGALLEKRNLFTTKEGGEKMGKAKGFNLTDLNYVIQNWEEIKSLM
jgi:ribosomal protein S28E/S33